MAEQRSKPYPAMPVSDAVIKLKELYKKLGDSKSYNRENFAQGLGYKDSKNGAYLRAVAALVQYGLIEKDGNAYKLSGTARRILIPTTDTSEAEAVKEAALTPSLFAQLFERYEGQELPGLLPNILVTEFGILDGAKNKAVGVFRSSMEHVGVLDGNTLGERVEEPRESEYEADDRLDATYEVVRSPEAETSRGSEVPTTALVKDFGNGRVARLAIPSDLNDDEREKLASLIRSM